MEIRNANYVKDSEEYRMSETRTTQLPSYLKNIHKNVKIISEWEKHYIDGPA
jgi:hypothetical protein